MSPANADIVRTILDEWGKGDFASSAGLYDEDITFETFMPDTGKVSAHGLYEMQAFTRDWLAQWSSYRIAAVEVEETRPDTVLATVRQLAAGKHSGTEVDSSGYAVWRFEDGKVVALSLHYDRDEARRAAR